MATRVFSNAIGGSLLVISTASLAGNLLFPFEGAGTGPDLVWGTNDTVGYPQFLQQGLIIDVIASSVPNDVMHWHETNSLLNSKVPDRPVGSAGVLWRDSHAGLDPLVLTLADPGYSFALQGIVVGSSTADGSATTAIRLKGFSGTSIIGTVDLTAPSNSYQSYTLSSFGALQGAGMTRLEIVGLSASSLSYYMLDDLNITTSPIPEPSTFASMVAGLAVIVGLGRKRDV